MYYIYFFLTSFCLSILFTIAIKWIAEKFKIIDIPEKFRKIHNKAVPLLGGMAIFLSFFIILFFAKEKILVGNLNNNHWIGFFIGACFLMLGGYIDDKYNISAKYQIICPLLAIVSVILGGVEIEKITNPFGGFINLGVFSSILIFFWLISMMYTTKLLDGVDGLVSGMAVIGGLIIFLFTITTKYYQPDIAIASLILSGSSFGFLLFNWHPAKIFLGEGGSLFVGFVLGTLAIISGGKIAIALLIMGIPILDLFWTIIRRFVNRKNPFKIADKNHFHHRLLRLGLGQKGTVILYYLVALIFGLSGLFLQSLGKAIAFIFLIIIMLVMIIYSNYLDSKNSYNKFVK